VLVVLVVLQMAEPVVEAADTFLLVHLARELLEEMAVTAVAVAVLGLVGTQAVVAVTAFCIFITKEK